MTLSDPFWVLGRFLRALDPETAHRLTIRGLRAAILPPRFGSDDKRLRVNAFGLQFPNPVGLAAGFDKNAEVIDAMLRFGFGFVEAGSVTPLPQPGNPKPRLFRLKEDFAVINRLGFNNEGIAAARSRLLRRQGRSGIAGINIGANKDADDRIADYVRGLTELGPLAQYVTVNISSPNTPGLRGLQNKAELEALLAAVLGARETLPRYLPVLLKIAPDLDEEAIKDIVRAVLRTKLDGLIVSNTTIARPASLKSSHAVETGGLSGVPLFEPSTAVLKTVARTLGGQIPVIGVGGIASGEDAYAKIRAGASLVQLYTALIYQGPGLVSRIKRGLLRALERDGLTSIEAAIGKDL